MKRKWMLIAVVASLWIATSAMAQDPNDKPGLTAWALGGSGVQELRIGYEGLLPTVEFAIGTQHIDAPQSGIDEWPIRVYAIAHALDASMLASVLGADFKLPDGNVYAGLFGEYSFDREDEWSGGYVVGGLVQWPRGWQTVLEYDATLFNASDSDYQVMLGLRRRF